jgi:hypothetical protein
MKLRPVIALLCLLSLANVGAAVVNFSTQSKAAAGATAYERLVTDQNFARAVKSIVEGCAVNVDLGKLKC